MKVLMLVYQVARTPLGNRPGNVALALSEGGHQVSAVKFDWRHEEGGTQYLEDVRVDSIVYGGLTSKVRTLLGLPWLYSKLIPHVIRVTPDVIYCEHPFVLPFAVVASGLTGSAVVYDAYDMFSIQLFGPAETCRRAVAERIEDWFVAGTNHVLTIDTAEDFLAERYGRSTDVTVLYNVPRLETEVAVRSGDRHNTAPDRSVLDQFGDGPLLAYAGGISPGKGAVVMIESLARVVQSHPDATLVFIGRYKGNTRRLVADRLEELDLSDRFVDLGWMPYLEMLPVLRAADVGLAPYQPIGHYPIAGAGQGRKVFTYMQAGLPIVGPDFGEIGNVVAEVGCGRLVDTTDPGAIGGMIDELLDEPGLAKRLGERGRDAIEQRYNWERESEALLEVFDGLERMTAE
jgi:glycosyltransferase involved in cell wall biosynthesis